MKIFDKYLFSEWLKIFCITTLSILGILLLHNIYNDLKDLIEWKTPLLTIFKYYLILIPSFIPTILPISLLLSILYILGLLHRNNEITAMRAIGLSTFRITASLWVVGVFFVGVLFFLNASYVPWSVEKSRQIFDNAKFNYQSKYSEQQSPSLMYNLGFANEKEHRIWMMNSYNNYIAQAQGVSITQNDENGNIIFQIKARKAYFDDYNNAWFFSDGLIDYYKNNKIIRRQKIEKDKSFAQINETPDIMLLMNKRPQDLSYKELKKILDFSGNANNAFLRNCLVRYSRVPTIPLFCIFIVAIAIPFAISKVRTNPMVGVSKSMGMFFSYFVVENIFSTLGSQFVISPVLAAWLPFCIMALIAGLVYMKEN